MIIPEGLIPLVDGDILRYEVGYAAETGWKARTQSDRLPPFEYVREQLHSRLEHLQAQCNTSQPPRIYMTKGKTFRYDLAKKKPYKGTRPEKKPFHFKNLAAHLRDVLGATEITGIEADDQLAIDHSQSGLTTVLCSRDKDLRQVPGWFYSWELGKQASFGPHLITKEGWLKLERTSKGPKLTGTGLAWFYAQVLTGDPTDNIPGLPNTGPVAAFELLRDKSSSEQLKAVREAYRSVYEPIDDRDRVRDIHSDVDVVWEQELLEQGRLCWLTRRLNGDGSPQLWEIGMEE